MLKTIESVFIVMNLLQHHSPNSETTIQWFTVIHRHIYINSIRNKFDRLIVINKGNVDKLMIPETKLYELFPFMLFKFDG